MLLREVAKPLRYEARGGLGADACRSTRVIVRDGRPVSHIAVVYSHLCIEGAAG